MILSIFSGIELSADLHANLFHPKASFRAVVGDRNSEVGHPGKVGLPVFRIFKSVYDAHLKNQTYRRVYRFAFISKLSLTFFMFFNKSGHNGILLCQGFVQKGVKLLNRIFGKRHNFLLGLVVAFRQVIAFANQS